ncbi:MAG: DNA cytosine methyltransferase [Prevotella sp.]|nr:DNA cytosine methyltransferase [Prevotella sp.]
MEGRTYNISEVAEIMGMTLKVVRRFVASEELKTTKKNNTYTISQEDLNIFKRYIEDGKHQKHAQEVADSFSQVSQMDLFAGTEFAGFSSVGKTGDKVNWIDVDSVWDSPSKSEMTFVDLFCGAGGLSKGLEMSGLIGICGLDWFNEACMTYNRNFNHPFVNGDIKDPENKKKFYETVRKQLNGRKLSVVAGGFPCQGFSMAGNRIVDDPRNSLYKELIEIVVELQPEFVVCENVKGLRTMLNGLVEKKIIADFKEIGYDMNVTTLCAADYYTPQKRERVIFIGNRIGKKNYHPKPILTPEEYITTGQAIADLMNHPVDPDFNHVPTVHREDMAKRIMETPEGSSLYKGYSDAWKKCPWDAPSCTIKENHGGVNLHPKLPRVLTAREMARLQSFPDDFIFEGKKNKQLVQIGNAVPPLLGKAIGLAVRYSNDDLPKNQS